MLTTASASVIGACALTLLLSAGSSLLFGGESIASAGPASAGSEAGTLSTDRPDFTESTAVVGKGLFQLESGLLVTFDRTGDERSRGLKGPLPLLRLGVGQRWELRFGADGLVRETVQSAAGFQHRTGLSDGSVGVKVELFRERSFLPAISLIPAVSVPVGAQPYSSAHADPSVKVAWSRTLPRGWDLAGNWNIGSTVFEERRKLERAWSLTAAHELRRGWRGYWEVYRLSPADDRSMWVANTGLTHSLGSDAQFDIEIGRAVKTANPSWFAGVGLAVRRSMGLRAARSLLRLH